MFNQVIIIGTISSSKEIFFCENIKPQLALFDSKLRENVTGS